MIVNLLSSAGTFLFLLLLYCRKNQHRFLCEYEGFKSISWFVRKSKQDERKIGSISGSGLKLGECCWIFEHTAEFCSSNSESECHFSILVTNRILLSFKFRISSDFCFIKNCKKSVELYWRVNDVEYMIFLTYIFFYIVFSIDHHRIS